MQFLLQLMSNEATGSAAQAIKMAHLKVDTSKAQLKNARKAQEKAVADRIKGRAEINKAMNELAELTQKAQTLEVSL